MVRQLAITQTVQTYAPQSGNPCGICGDPFHPTDASPLSKRALFLQNSAPIPSQTVPNPKGSGNVCAISLRSGKIVEEPTQAAVEPTQGSDTSAGKQNTDMSDMHISLPFPQRATQSKKKAEKAQDKEILDTFRKVEINILLLDAIQQIPRYAKFMKELCTNKRRLKGDERVSVSQNVSTLIQPMPKKFQDLGTFTILCIIGNSIFHDCMLDIGASINVMPESVYMSLGLGPLRATGIVVQLANKSRVHPSSVVEDILVRVNNLIFHADFYILGMEGETSSSTIILGRPFMKTARTKIDVHADEVVDDIFADLTAQYPEFSSFLDFDLSYGCTDSSDCTTCAEIAFGSALKLNSKLLVEIIDDSISENLIAGLDVNVFSAEPAPTRLLPPTEQPPKLELKVLPDHLNQWVSPVQVVPKKSRVTVVANQKNELVSARAHNSWRVCIDYRRLNQATRKDHYPLSFIDQMLELLAGTPQQHEDTEMEAEFRLLDAAYSP
ncbi:uncharacterized protein LOC133309302 [Gastrolobium bilobum]|uniref:uncharacterized protein LOC133309302 n=1 Tax=Gastrolobium bilobum TaxID=150636 RepID=UPI002AB0D9FB|nr:uncharacterized protein LOC133309302 [Gastrolobium bilobum]